MNAKVAEKNQNEATKVAKPAKTKDSVKSGKKQGLASTQRYLQFAGAKEDTLILKNGGLRAILEVSAINFHLKSEPEQQGIIRAYQRMLNSLDFPVQILVQSRKLDIDDYVVGLKEKAKKLDNEMLRNQMYDYINYISQLVNYADIMSKTFYIVVPIDPPYVKPPGMLASFLAYINPQDSVLKILQRQREFIDLKKQLESRVNVVMTSIEGIGVKAKRVKTAEIISLFYSTYNPDLSRLNKWKTLADLPVEDQ